MTLSSSVLDDDQASGVSTVYHINYCLYVLVDVGQFLASLRVILESLLSQYTGKTLVEKLCNSVFSMAARQLVRHDDGLCEAGGLGGPQPRAGPEAGVQCLVNLPFRSSFSWTSVLWTFHTAHS